MDIHETEEQQVEALKKWWAENRSSIAVGVLLGLAVLFGGRAWFSHQQAQSASASNLYTGMMVALSQGEETLVTERAGMLIADFSSTPYATLAALALAKVRLEQEDFAAARAQLQWALDNGDAALLQQVVRLRLARVLLAENNLDGAAALLDEAPADPAFAPLVADVRGDIALAGGNVAGAREAYTRALAGLEAGTPGHRLVELKLEDTGRQDAPGEPR